MRIDEIRILCNHDTLLLIRGIDQILVAGAVAVRQVEGVNGVRPGSGEPSRHPSRELGVNEKVHGPTGWMRFVRLSRAA